VPSHGQKVFRLYISPPHPAPSSQVKQENQLLRSQLQTRLADLATTKARLVELEERLAAARAAEREVEQRLHSLALLQVCGRLRLAGLPGESCKAAAQCLVYSSSQQLCLQREG
jgi:hypothetical protein